MHNRSFLKLTKFDVNFFRKKNIDWSKMKGFTLNYLKMLKLIISIRKISKIPLTFLA
jgi:hypothetical protein